MKPGREAPAQASFQRRNRVKGGTSRSYSDSVSKPMHAQKEKNETLIVSLIGLICPPIAIAYYWYMGRFDVRLRAGITAALFLLTTLYFYWLIPASTPETYQPTIVRPHAVTEYSPSSSAGNGSAY